MNWPRRPHVSLLSAATIWSAGDALLHVAIGEVELLRILGNALAVLIAVAVSRLDSIGRPRTSQLVGWAGAAELLTLDLTWIYIEGSLPAPALILMSVGLGLIVAGMAGRTRRYVALRRQRSGPPRRLRTIAVAVGATVVVAAACTATAVVALLHALTAGLYDGRLEAADYFTPDPQILSAGMGFDGIIGLPDLGENAVRAAGGGYASSLSCADSGSIDEQARSSAAVSEGIDRAFRLRRNDTVIEEADGLPVVFSWPVRSDTIHPEEFKLTLTDGEVVFPDAAGITPNWELDERQTVVLFGQFGDRGAGDDALFPKRIDIVDAGGESLMLAGPDGDVSATGLSLTMDHSGYAEGPTLVAAKLTRVPPELVGEGGVVLLGREFLPNDELSLYGADAQYRLRMLTTGGFSPDGVLGLQPDDFDKYFRLEATGADGEPVSLTETDVDYEVQGGTVRVVGLSDLGHTETADGYDDCYSEDADNQIDIILAGDESAIRSITHLEMPGLQHGYESLYNPGGPGPDPERGTRYTKPSPSLRIAVTEALDNPMQVTRD